MSNRPRLRRLMVWLIALIPVLAFAVYAVGMFFELEYPYWWTLRSVRSAAAPNGQPALPQVARDLDVPVESLHVHTCSYCADWFHVSGVAYVQVTAGNAERLPF